MEGRKNFGILIDSTSGGCNRQPWAMYLENLIGSPFAAGVTVNPGLIIWRKSLRQSLGRV